MPKNSGSIEKQFMKIALDRVSGSLTRGDFPIGAVLVIDNKVIDKSNNSGFTDNQWISHAEMILLHRNSAHIKKMLTRALWLSYM